MKRNRLILLGLTAIIFLLIGYFGVCKLYPCKVSPVIAEPVYTWSVCSMNLLATKYILGISEMYFGLSYNLGRFVALVLNWVIAYLIVIGLIYAYNKFKK